MLSRFITLRRLQYKRMNLYNKQNDHNLVILEFIQVYKCHILKYYSSQMEYSCIKVINKYIHPS